MHKKAKKALSACIALVLTLTLFASYPSLPASAARDSVYTGVDPVTLCSVIDGMVDDFNIATVGWTSSGAKCEAVSSLEKAPYSPYEGSRALMMTADGYRAGGKITVSGPASMLGDTAAYDYIAAVVWVPEEAAGATITMKLTASRGSISDTKRITAGTWQILFFELKGASKGNASKIELTFSFEASCDLYFLLDTVGGCKDETDIFAARYMTSSFTASGCTVGQDDSLTVTLSGADQYIEAASPVITDLSPDTGIRVDLINRSSCRSLTLKYKSLGSSEYDRQISVDIPDSDGVVSCLFDIPEGYIGAFALCFDGSPSGEIELLSIGASPCFVSRPYLGSITECRIARDKKNVSVKGSLNGQASEEYDGSAVFLYELSAFEDLDDIVQKTPLSEGRLSDGAFSFTVPLDQERNGMYKKYTAAVYSDGSLIPICGEVFINNPEILASERTSLPESKKGIAPLPDNYVLDGIAQTAVEIRADQLLTFSSEDSVRYEAGGVSHRFSSRYLDELDKKMKEYEREGISVRFILRLGETDDLSLSSLLCHPNSSGGKYKAFNTESNEGLTALRVLTDLLVNRYGSNDGKTDNLIGIVLGSSVNEAYENYNMANTSLAELARSYSSALRVVYNTAVSITSGFEVSMPLGGDWYGSNTAGQRASFDARTMLEAVCACIKSGGDIGWKLSYDITPAKGSYAWAEASPYFGADAKTITAANLEALTSFFSLSQFHFNGASRSILLLGTEPRQTENENDLISLSADYIYTLLRISDRSMKAISGYIPSHEAGYENAIRYTETDIFEEKTAFAAELIGKDRYQKLISASTSTIRSYAESSAGSTIPSSIKGESLLFDFSSSKELPSPSVGCLSIENGVVSGGSKDWLRVVMAKTDPNALRGFSMISETPLDLSVAPYLSLNVICSSLPDGIESIELTVAVFSGRNVLSSSTVISASKGESTVVCDLSSFSHLSSCDRISIYIRGENGEDVGTPELYIRSVKALSETMSGGELENAIKAGLDNENAVSLGVVIAVASVTALAVFAEIARLISKNRAKKENE